MEISNNINSMQNHFNQLDKNSTTIANSSLQPEKSDNIARSLTDNISLENGIDAQIASIQTKDEVFGTLLDIVG